MKRYFIPMVVLLAICLSHTAQGFYMHNSTVLAPTTLNMTFEIADWYNITEQLVIDVKGIQLNDYWLETEANETMNMTVYNYSELYRVFDIENSTTPTYLEFNLSGMNRSTSAEVYADFVLVANITTNSSGWLNFVFNQTNMSSDSTTKIIINQTVNNTQTAVVTPPTPTTPTGGGYTIVPPGITNCSFELYPNKLIGTGRPDYEIDPMFTMYIKNLFMNQSFSIDFDPFMGLNCFIDYSNNPNRGIAIPGEFITYKIGCMTDNQTQNGTIFVTTSEGCIQNLTMEVRPTVGITDEIDVAFAKFGFGDYTGFLSSKINGVEVAIILMILVFLLIILIIILLIATIGR